MEVSRTESSSIPAQTPSPFEPPLVVAIAVKPSFDIRLPLLVDVRKPSDNLRGIVPLSKVAQHEADRNPGSFDPRFTSKDIGLAFYMILPRYMHLQPRFWSLTDNSERSCGVLSAILAEITAGWQVESQEREPGNSR